VADAPHLRTVHHDGFDPAINSLFVPAIKVDAGKLVFVSGVTAAPVYHDHPHIPHEFDTIQATRARKPRWRSNISRRPSRRGLRAAARRHDDALLHRYCRRSRCGQRGAGRILSRTSSDQYHGRSEAHGDGSRIKLEIQAIAVAPA